MESRDGINERLDFFLILDNERVENSFQFYCMVELKFKEQKYL